MVTKENKVIKINCEELFLRCDEFWWLLEVLFR